MGAKGDAIRQQVHASLPEAPDVQTRRPGTAPTVSTKQLAALGKGQAGRPGSGMPNKGRAQQAVLLSGYSSEEDDDVLPGMSRLDPNAPLRYTSEQEQKRMAPVLAGWAADPVDEPAQVASITGAVGTAQYEP